MRQRGVFYGWVVLGAAATIVCVGMGAMFSLGVFLKPIEDSMGWSRSSISAIGLLNWIVMGAGGVAAGYLSDRFGTRGVVLVGGGLLGLGLVLSSQVRETWQLYLTFGVLVGAGVSAFYVPLTVLAIKWFDARRGMAAAIVSAGNGFGILALSPLSRWLITEFDWRTAFLLLGDLSWLIVLPCGLLLRNAPAPRAAPAPARPAARSPAREALGTWPFWGIALTHFSCCAAHSGPLFHLVTYAMDQGVAKMTAATILGASGLSSIFGRIGTGMVADRVGAKQTLLTALGLQAGLIALYVFVSGAGALYAVSLVFGVAYGGAIPLYALITRDYFGEKVMGTAYGAVFFISCIGMGAGSYAGGAIHDALGSYQWLFLGSFAIGTVAVFLGLTLRPPRLAARAALPA